MTKYKILEESNRITFTNKIKDAVVQFAKEQGVITQDVYQTLF